MKRTNTLISGLFGLLLSAAFISVIPAQESGGSALEEFGYIVGGKIKSAFPATSLAKAIAIESGDLGEPGRIFGSAISYLYDEPLNPVNLRTLETSVRTTLGVNIGHYIETKIESLASETQGVSEEVIKSTSTIVSNSVLRNTRQEVLLRYVVVNNDGDEKHGAYLALSIAAPDDQEILESLAQARSGETAGKEIAGNTKDVNVDLDKTGAVIRKVEEALAADPNIQESRKRLNQE
jgi:hypothetical protein